MTFKPQTGICSDFYSEMGQIYFALLFFFGKQQNFITIQIRIEIRKLKINTEEGNSSLPWVIVKFKILDYLEDEDNKVVFLNLLAPRRGL